MSNRKEHKNEVRLVEAFAKAKIPNNVNLIFTGNATDKLNSVMMTENISDRVKFVGQVDEEHLVELYQGALAHLCPSLYEGFGLPNLEAMACGTPVLTSNLTAIPEIVGDAALLVNPFQTSEITSGIENLYFDTELRSTLRSKGLLRAENYSWSNTIKRIEFLFEEKKNKK